MFLEKRKWDAICKEVIARLDREKFSRREALDQIMDQRRRAYEHARKQTSYQWISTCGYFMACLYGFYAYERKKPIYLFHSAVVLVCLLSTVGRYSDSRSSRFSEVVSKKSSLRKNPFLPHLPVTLEMIRERQLDLVIPLETTDFDVEDF